MVVTVALAGCAGTGGADEELRAELTLLRAELKATQDTVDTLVQVLGDGSDGLVDVSGALAAVQDRVTANEDALARQSNDGLEGRLSVLEALTAPVVLDDSDPARVRWGITAHDVFVVAPGETDERSVVLDGDLEGVYATTDALDVATDSLQTWVDDQDLAPKSYVDDGDAAERVWVSDQGYAPTTYVDDGDAAERAWVSGENYASLTYVDDGDDAERTWVASQGYATTTYVNESDAVMLSWVADQGYATVTYVTFADDEVESWVTDQDYATVSYVDVADDGVESWVTDQGYATAINLELAYEELEDWVEAQDYATATNLQVAYEELEDWVEAQDYLTTSDLTPVESRLQADIDATADRVELLEGDRVVLLGSRGEQLVYQVGISGVFADLHEALEWLSSRRIHPGAEVVLQLQSGSHYYEESVVVSHADGARLRIVGDGSTSTLLSFDTGLAGLVAEDGAVIGGIDGLALVGDDGEEAGVVARRGAVVRLGGDLRVEGFAHGVHATLGAVIEAEAGVVTLSNFGAGFLADRGGVVRVEGSNALANESSGYIAADGGVLLADGGSSQGNASDGFLATDGGFISARGGLAESNGQHGFVAQGADMVISDAEAMSHAGDTSFLATRGASMWVAPNTWATAADSAFGFLAEGGSTLAAGESITEDITFRSLMATDGSALVAEGASLDGTGVSSTTALHAESGATISALGTSWSGHASADSTNHISAAPDYGSHIIVATSAGP
jgi:hypothetical protein